MKIILVDDERFSLELLEKCVRGACPEDEITSFHYTFGGEKQILDFVSANLCDVAFLDVEMPGVNGIALAKGLKELNPRLNVIFVTAYMQYTADALSIRASGYILKPPTEEMILEELNNLRYPLNIRRDRLYFHTFGNFEVLYNGTPVVFHRARSKEILAYLVDRKGGSVSLSELSSVLFEDREYDRSMQKQLQVYIRDMLLALDAVGERDVVIRNRGSLSINTGAVGCDYYDFLKLEPAAVNAYCGEYMINYSWAEFTAGWLERKLSDN